MAILSEKKRGAEDNFFSINNSGLFAFFFVFYFGCTRWHVGSQFPNQGSNLRPLLWKHGFLITGLPGKSLNFFNLLKKKTVFIEPGKEQASMKAGG